MPRPRAAELADAVARRLEGRALACAESCTAGRVSQACAAVAGAADWFRGGLVAYQVGVKRSLLDVESDSVLTAEAAEEMARGIAALLEAQAAIATTGVAGDEPEDGVEPGTVLIATYVDGDVSVAEHRFEGDPGEVCDSAASFALESLAEHLRRRNAA